MSPGELQRDRDYVAKRSQYQDLGVPEYWIIDPQEATILVLELNNGVYTEVMTCSGDAVVQSSQFGTLTLTAHEVFAAASSET